MTSLCLFSGGKDSTMALLRELSAGRECLCLIVANKGYSQLSDGLETKTAIVANIARGLFGQPVIVCQTSDQLFRTELVKCVSGLLRQGNIDRVVTGDLNHPDAIINYLRKRLSRIYRSTNFVSVGEAYARKGKFDPDKYLADVFKRLSLRIVGLRRREFAGREKMFLGKKLNERMIDKIKKLGIDPLGEDGEYQTLVVGLKRVRKHIKIESSVVKKVRGRDRKDQDYQIEDIKKWSFSN